MPLTAGCFRAPGKTSGRNADADPEEIQRIVDKAVSEVRAERRTREKADTA